MANDKQKTLPPFLFYQGGVEQWSEYADDVITIDWDEVDRTVKEDALDQIERYIKEIIEAYGEEPESANIKGVLGDLHDAAGEIMEELIELCWQWASENGCVQQADIITERSAKFGRPKEGSYEELGDKGKTMVAILRGKPKEEWTS